MSKIDVKGDKLVKGDRPVLAGSHFHLILFAWDRKFQSVLKQ
jgi:urease beta subunit